MKMKGGGKGEGGGFEPAPWLEKYAFDRSEADHLRFSAHFIAAQAFGAPVINHGGGPPPDDSAPPPVPAPGGSKKAAPRARKIK